MAQEKRYKIISYLKNICCWVCSSSPQGIGTLLVGVAALIALCQTNTVLDKILLVQKQADQIGIAVVELKDQSKKIASAIDLLGFQLKEMKAAQAIKSSPALQSANPTKEQIKEAIKIIPTMPSTKRSTIYLPPDRVEGTVDLIYKEKNPAARAEILQNSLEYTSSGYLLDQNDNKLVNENGGKIILETNTNGTEKKK